MSHRDSCLVIAIIAALSLGFIACTKTAEAPPAPLSQSASAAAAPPPDAAQQRGAPAAGAPGLQSSHTPIAAAPAGNSPHGMLTWDTPASWTQEQPSNAMRMAQYRVPAAGGETDGGECVVFYFGPGQGGDAPSNVSRWVSMFTTPDTSANLPLILLIQWRILKAASEWRLSMLNASAAEAIDAALSRSAARVRDLNFIRYVSFR